MGVSPRAAKLLAGLTLIAVAALGAAGTRAAFDATRSHGSNAMSSGTVSVSDNDGGSAMLSLSNAAPGATDTSCIKATSNGSLASELRHHATVGGDLPPYLSLKVTRGTGAAGFDDCTGFGSDSTDYFGKGPGVLYDGKLSSYPSSWSGGIVDPAGGDSYSTEVNGTPSLLGYWRLGDGAIAADELNDSAGTLLQSHTGAIGASWTKHSLSSTDVLFTNANRVRPSTTGRAVYPASAVPSSADYTVEADLHVASVMNGEYTGVIGRMDTSNANGTFYTARYHTNTGVWDLNKFVNGTSTSVGTYAQTLTAGQTYRLTLDMSGSTIRLLVDGVQRVSVTDISIPGAGRGGVRFNQTSTAQTNTTGIHVDNFRITSGTTTAADSKGTHTGTYGGGVRLNQPGALARDSNRSALFDGTSGMVEVPDSAPLRLTGSFSTEAWIKPESVVGTRYLLNRGTMYYLYLSGSDLVFGFRSGGVHKYVTAAGAASTGSWQHVVGTYDGGELSIYRNGERLASAPASGAVDTVAANLFVGALSAAGSMFQGEIDDAALYNGALSAQDVSAHYAAGAGLETWGTGESHDYKFQVTLDDDAAALGKSGTATFHWETRNR